MVWQLLHKPETFACEDIGKRKRIKSMRIRTLSILGRV
jgi:hypothetical protein